MAKVELKKPVVAEISENIKDAQAVVLVSYCGITVEADTALRKELREAGITYKVYKNTMMNFAFKDTDCEGRMQSLFQKMMRLLRQESFPSMRRKLRH